MNYALHLASKVLNTFSSISAEEKKSNNDSTEQALIDMSEESSSLTDMLINCKELKWLSTKTGIDPKYFFYFFSAVLLLFLIQYFSNFITLIIGVIYPIRQSMHELRLRNKEGTRIWMQYWIVFFLFINIETLLGKVLTQIPMYLFYKIVFLIICFFPYYNGADYFYNAFLHPPFKSYERQIYTMVSKIYRRITKKMYVE